jgi:GxxExxY protein
MKITKENVNQMVYEIITLAINVHKELGPGLLESVYETCFEYELKANGFMVQRQMVIPIKFRNLTLDANLKLDLLIDDLIVVELKAIEGILPVHEAQVLSYMKLLKKPKGIIINFCSDNITRSTKHFVNEFFRDLPER